MWKRRSLKCDRRAWQGISCRFHAFIDVCPYYSIQFLQESATVLKRKSFKMGPLAHHSHRVIKDYHASVVAALLWGWAYVVVTASALCCKGLAQEPEFWNTIHYSPADHKTGKRNKMGKAWWAGQVIQGVCFIATGYRTSYKSLACANNTNVKDISNTKHL